jgi:hypothetical protein
LRGPRRSNPVRHPIGDTGVAVVETGWTAIDVSTGAAPPLLALRNEALGATLAVVRADAPNSDAWRSKTREAYAAEVEAGVKAAAEGYRRDARTLHLVNEVPTLDLRFRRTVDGVRRDRRDPLLAAPHVHAGADRRGAREAVAQGPQLRREAGRGLRPGARNLNRKAVQVSPVPVPVARARSGQLVASLVSMETTRTMSSRICCSCSAGA